MITLNLLGSLQILVHDKPVTLTSVKAQALVVYLALTERTHSRLALAGLLWPEKSDKEARNNLRQVLYTLRPRLPDLLVTTRESVGLRTDQLGPIDIHQFEEQARFGLAGDVDALQRTAELYQGDFLTGFHVNEAAAFDEWMLLTRERLHKLAFQVLEQVTAHFVTNQDSRRGLRYAEQLLLLEPWHEETHYHIMQMLAWNGQTQRALTQFDRCRRLLADELGTTPSVKLVTLANEIRQGAVERIIQPLRLPTSVTPVATYPRLAVPYPPIEHAPIEHAVSLSDTVSLSVDVPQHPSRHSIEKLSPSATAENTLHNLPIYPSSFIGRTAELATLRKMILSVQQTEPSHGAHRLVTLLGPGGVGKTRLALQLATTLRPHFRDGTWFVDLATWTDQTLVALAIATTLGVHEKADRSLQETLINYLADKSLLLILDNCEHLLDGCAQLVQPLLDAAALVQIVATSREPLRVRYEQRFLVAPLALPPARALSNPDMAITYESIRLFVDRAGAISPDFALTKRNLAAIVTICQLLDGLPLATELVAARTRILTVEQIAEQLQMESTAQLRLAAQVRNHGPQRHHTLRNLIAWSYQLLPPVEQLLLQRLSIFTGSCTFAAVEQICADDARLRPNDVSIAAVEILDLLEGLIDKSLVVAEPVGSQMRYRLLESIRQFALEKLMAFGGEVGLRNRHLDFYVAYMERVEAERTALPRDVWRARIQPEIDNVRLALSWAVTRDRASLGVRIAIATGEFWFNQGLHRESARWFEQLLAIPGTTMPPALRLAALSAMEFTQWWVLENYAVAQTLQREILMLAKELGAQKLVEKALNNLGGVAIRTGEYAAAHDYLDRSLALSAKSGNRLNHAWSYILLGEVAMDEGDHDHAETQFQQAANHLRPIRARNLLAYPVRRLGHLAQWRQDYAGALSNYHESLQLNAEVGELEGKCASLVSYARLLSEFNESQLAIQLCAVVDTTLRTNQIRLPFYERSYYTETLAALQATTEEAAFSTAWKTGSTIPVAVAIDIVIKWQAQYVKGGCK